jgi:hypothetical protein
MYRVFANNDRNMIAGSGTRYPAAERLGSPRCDGAEMKVTAIETIHFDVFPNAVYVRVHTDAGLIGLGDTFLGPESVAIRIRAVAAPLLLGQDPFLIERRWHDL